MALNMCSYEWNPAPVTRWEKFYEQWDRHDTDELRQMMLEAGVAQTDCDPLVAEFQAFFGATLEIVATGDRLALLDKGALLLHRAKTLVDQSSQSDKPT